MIKNFHEWDGAISLNEDKSSFLKVLTKQTGKSADELISTGYKGIGSIIRKLFGASADDIAKFDKGLASVVNVQKEAWWQSLPKASRKALEKDADDIAKKYIEAYNAGDDGMIKAARQASKEYIEKTRNVGTTQKAIDELTTSIDDAPTRKLRTRYQDELDNAQETLDDAIRSSDPEKMAAARKSAQSVDDMLKDAGRKSVFERPTTRIYGRNGILGRGMEPGADLTDDALNALRSQGKDGMTKNLNKEIKEEGKGLLSWLSRRSKGAIVAEEQKKGGFWRAFGRNVKRLMVAATLAYTGGVVWNYIKGEKQNKAAESFMDGLEAMKKDLMENGITLTKVDANKASFSDMFRLFFAGDKSDLPVDDAPELTTMFNAGSSVTDFFAKTAQLCFEYPSKYFKEKEADFTKASRFYGFTKKINEEIGIPRLLSAVEDAGGMAAQALEDTFYKDGEPVSLDEYGYASFSNPSMKILLGQNEPVRPSDIIDESKEFLEMFSSFKRKITNDFIQDRIESFLSENGTITQEEFNERASRIEKDLGSQLSEKEEAFVAMSGLILSYNTDSEPFTTFYKFDDDNFYQTVDAIGSLMGEEFDLRSKKQLSRMYMTINSEFASVYSEMGKERTLYGVMEYSTFGFVMRSLMNLLALEQVCKMITSSEGVEGDSSFTRSEVEEYQKVINQIQRKEGKSPTVVASGQLDGDTQEALKEYQKKLGLPETGKPGDKSLKAMKDYLISLVTSKVD